MHLAPLIRDLAVILGVAAVVTFLFRLIRQPVLLGYIFAGIIVGPYTPPIFSVIDLQNVRVWADLGVIFFMFALGLEFSFRRLIRVGASSAVTGIIQISTMISLGYICGAALGWPNMDRIFLGCMIAISSTTAILKVFEEMGLKTRKFSETVYGILIIQDLAAILILAALTNIATKDTFSSLDIFGAGARLALMVGAWLIIGMFIVPRLVRAVGKYGTSEMMLVVSLGLCFLLVSIADHFEYSVALGAFVMGSILSETRESHHIQELVSPLKDIFGAVFFISVGMLLDPSAIVTNFGSIITISAVVITGMILSITFGGLLTGQSLATAVETAFSMAQIGEFSFIIASVGVALRVIDPQLYPIMVIVSLVTTFLTPYLIRLAPKVNSLLEANLPLRTKIFLDVFRAWTQRQSPQFTKDTYERLLRWLANGIIVISLFLLSKSYVLGWIAHYVGINDKAQIICWIGTFIISAPFIWAMLTAFAVAPENNLDRKWRLKAAHIVGSFISPASTVLILGILSLEFFDVWISIALTAGMSASLFLIFRRRIGVYYHLIEKSFLAGINRRRNDRQMPSQKHAHLVPWDAHLAEVTVRPLSQLRGKHLAELQIRERFGINVIVISRDAETIVAPKADEMIFPGDVLLCFGTDEQLAGFMTEIDRKITSEDKTLDRTDYNLRQVEIPINSIVVGRSIKESGICEVFNCLVVGLERDGARIHSPESTLELKPGDSLWLVGETRELNRLKDTLAPDLAT